MKKEFRRIFQQISPVLSTMLKQPICNSYEPSNNDVEPRFYVSRASLLWIMQASGAPPSLSFSLSLDHACFSDCARSKIRTQGRETEDDRSCRYLLWSTLENTIRQRTIKISRFNDAHRRYHRFSDTIDTAFSLSLSLSLSPFFPQRQREISMTRIF